MTNWIGKAIKHPGAFTKKAKAAGLTPAQLQRKVLANPSRYSSTTVKQANLRKTLVRGK